MSQNGSIGHVLAVGALVIAVPGALLAWDQLSGANSSEEASPSGPGEGAGGATPTPSAEPPPPEQGTESSVSVEDHTSLTPVGMAGCEIFVDHIGAQIRAEPDHSSLSLASVPSGTYEPLGTTVSNWAGQDQRWFQLDVGGRIGWLVSDPIFITSQSAGCP